MTKKELKVIRNALSHAQDAIAELACENYPYSAFEDSDMRKMFYALNDMCIEVTKKMEDLK